MINRRAALATPLMLGACASSVPETPSPLLSPDSIGRQGQHPLALPVAGLSAPLRSWLYLPSGYGRSAHAWPLVVFLHGSGERGTELDLVQLNGPPRHAAAGRDYPFILCSPQLEAGQEWNPDTLHALLPALQARLRIDPLRITATGLSLGGHGVWSWAAAYPHDLAGIAPVCGYADPAAVCNARQVPVRAYHGDADTVVPLAEQQACVDALRACGGSVSFTIYPGVGHDAWIPAYEDPGLVPWLMARQRT